MIVVIGEFRLPVDRMAEARPAMEHVISASRAEDGCLAYTYAEDLLEPGLYRVSEAWSSRAALDAHFVMPHMQTWREEREALGMTDRRVTAYEAGSETQL